MRIWVDCPFLFLFYKFFFLAVVVYHTGQSSTYTMKLAELSSELFVAQRGGGIRIWRNLFPFLLFIFLIFWMEYYTH